MRASFFRCWLAAGAIWAVVSGHGNHLQAMQADPNEQQQEFTFLIESDADDVEQRAEKSQTPKFWLGITLKSVEGDLATYLGSSDGVLVDSVYPNSPASTAGLVNGDIIIAVGDEKLTDPKSLLTQMLAVKTGDDGKASALRLTVLRKSESKSIDLTPVARPDDTLKFTVNAHEHTGDPSKNEAGAALGFSFDLNEKSPEEVEKMIEKLHGVNADVRILRFGTPAKIAGDSKSTKRIEIHKSADGKNLEININREGDAPARVTVIRDGETKIYSSDKLGEMPEDIRKTVTDAIEKKGQVKVHGFKSDVTQEATRGEDGKKAIDRLGEMRERIALVLPDGNLELGDVMDKEFSERIRSMAKEIEARAHQTSKWAKAAAAMPEEIQELKSQVDSLRAEIKELREQLKSAAKQTADK